MKGSSLFDLALRMHQDIEEDEMDQAWWEFEILGTEKVLNCLELLQIFSTYGTVEEAQKLESSDV